VRGHAKDGVPGGCPALLATPCSPGAQRRHPAAAPVGGCPTEARWRLIQRIHNPNPADLNGDGWLCRLDLPSGGLTGHDNVVRVP
jgi:hypothetical protein